MQTETHNPGTPPDPAKRVETPTDPGMTGPNGQTAIQPPQPRTGPGVAPGGTPVTTPIQAAVKTQAKPPGKAPATLNRDRPMAWLILLALLGVGAIPMYLNLHSPTPANVHQDRALALTAETWRRRHSLYNGELTADSLAPVRDGIAQLDQPPGFVWMNQLSLESLDPLTTTDSELAYHMRLLTAAFGLLTIAAVFWAGFSVGGLTTASFSAMVCLACPALIYGARAGTPTVPLVGLETLSIASAMWALRPLRPAPPLLRQALGWGICGVSLGVAVLTGGPTVLAMVLLPILMICILSQNRLGQLLGLVASVFIAALMVMPWVVYVHGQDPLVWEFWLTELWPKNLHTFGVFGGALSDRGEMLGLLVLPWVFWLIGALAQPFSASSSGVRRRVFIGWAWFVLVTLLVLIGSEDQGMAVLLPALPAAAILIGQCLRLYSDLSAEGRHGRIWRVTRWPHLTLIGLVSVALPAGLYFQEALVEHDVLQGLIVAPMNWYYWLGLSVSLVLISVMSMRYAIRHYPGRALVCWSVWAVVLVSVTMIPLTRGPMMNPTPITPTPGVAEPINRIPGES